MQSAHASMTVELFDTDDEDRLREALALRFEVFVDEQHVPPEEETDAHDRADPDAVHAILREDGRPVATGRFFRTGSGEAQIGRMAVRKGVRGRGFGAALMAALIAEAVRRGYRHATLDAQQHAVGFYERFGFEPFGEPHLDAGIEHQRMQRHIP